MGIDRESMDLRLGWVFGGSWRRSRGVELPCCPSVAHRQGRRDVRADPHARKRWACGNLSQELCQLMSPTARQIVSNLTGVLVQAAHPKRIILFGSQARGDAATHSDFDIMVVERETCRPIRGDGPPESSHSLLRYRRRSSGCQRREFQVLSGRLPAHVYYGRPRRRGGPLSSGVNKHHPEARIRAS